VAAFAGQVFMSAVELKASAEVVEYRLCRGAAGGKQPKYTERCQNQVSDSGCQSFVRHCSDLTSVKELSLWHRPQLAPNSPS